MLPGLALALLAAWTVQALEVGAALRNGGRGHSVEPIFPKSLIQRSRMGGSRRKPSSFRTQRPTFRRSAHPSLRPNPVLGTQEGEGETSDSQVRATLGRVEEAILSSDPDSVPASWPRASAWSGD